MEALRTRKDHALVLSFQRAPGAAQHLESVNLLLIQLYTPSTYTREIQNHFPGQPMFCYAFLLEHVELHPCLIPFATLATWKLFHEDVSKLYP